MALTIKATLHGSDGGNRAQFDEGGDAVAKGPEGVAGVVNVTRRWRPHSVGNLTNEGVLPDR